MLSRIRLEKGWLTDNYVLRAEAYLTTALGAVVTCRLENGCRSLAARARIDPSF